MSENLKKTSTADELARERNRAAADRTLMAWIRTALSLIAFGFSIGKISEYLQKVNPERVLDSINSAQIFGEAFISLGVLALLLLLSNIGALSGELSMESSCIPNTCRWR